ncbi:MAG: thiolase family protein [Pirellula sp.]|nr:thiolase family protein [Pirellula sp.]
MKVWILGASRTPIGRFLGDFSNIPAPMLAGVSIRRTIERTRIDPSRIQELWIGNVLSAGLGQAPARQAALKGGLGEEVTCTQVSKVCGSGLQAVVLAVRALQSGQASACIATGMESMSQAPHLLVNSRMGTKYGSVAMLDSIEQDGLRCSQGNVAMGTYADRLACQQSVSRSDQDAWALLSHQRACAASDQGFFEQEIAPVLIDAKTTIRHDACPRQDTSLEKLAKLKPAFGSSGSVTAGNASGLADGAASLLVVDEPLRRTLSSQSSFRVLACAQHSQSPAELFTAPVEAIRKVCRYADLAPKEVDLFEINEAFAAQVIACVDQLGLAPERVNVHGGAIALGHPIGCSGTRILVTLMHAMERYGKRTGVASLCIGGGEAVAIAIEQEPID